MSLQPALMLAVESRFRANWLTPERVQHQKMRILISFDGMLQGVRHEEFSTSLVGSKKQGGNKKVVSYYIQPSR